MALPNLHKLSYVRYSQLQLAKIDIQYMGTLMPTICIKKTRQHPSSFLAVSLHRLGRCLNYSTGHQKCNGVMVVEVCKDWIQIFKDSGIPDPEMSVELIVAHAMGKKMLHEVPDDALVQEQTARYIKSMCGKRLQRWPLQYIIEEWDFHELTLKMRPPVFIPRPETEELAGFVCDSIRSRGMVDACFLEIGCGSGAISLYLLCQLLNIKGVAVDKSIQACNLTRENADRYCVSDRLNILHLDFSSEDSLQKLKEFGPFDVAVSNPPYIPTGEIPELDQEVEGFEDRLALDGGHDGLESIRLMLDRVPELLKPNSQIWLEVGLGQSSAVADVVCQDSRLTYTATKKDFTGRDRFCVLTIT